MQRKGITDKNVLERVTKYLYDNIGNRTSMKSISDNIVEKAREKSLAFFWVWDCNEKIVIV